MNRASIWTFERRRAFLTIGTAKGLGTTAVGAVLFGLFAAYSGFGGSVVQAGEILPILGAAWSSLATVYAIDRNRGSVVEDVWFALEPAWRRQLVAVSAAWLPVAYLQALMTSLVILAVHTQGWASAIARMHAGFAFGAPACLLLSVVARTIPGFSLLAGFAFIILLVFAQVVWSVVSAHSPVVLVASLAAYVFVTLALFGLLTRSSGRSR